MIRRLALVAATAASLAAGIAAAQSAGPADPRALALAKQEAREAIARSERLERQAADATSEAARARAEASALAARIQAAEADLTAAETRIRIIENLRREQRARLAERQRPLIRLTAALQTMARRPPALALVQPGTLTDAAHVRSLLASTLPVIRARTAALRQEVDAANALQARAEQARAALIAGQRALRERRIDLAELEARQRRRSADLSQSALLESDRALALGEEARTLAAEIGTRRFQAQLQARLAELPGPVLRPLPTGAAPPLRPARNAAARRYILPVEGRLVRGMGEISDAGVHARGLTFEVEPRAAAVAPAGGRIVYAGAFRSYGQIVIIDHGGGWTTLVTNLAAVSGSVGDRVRMGQPVGRTGEAESEVRVELRRNGRPFPIAPLIAIG